jgi:hypothetical protein
MRGDRRSAIESMQLSLAREFELGLAALQAESLAGATAFASGKGRHGSFE